MATATAPPAAAELRPHRFTTDDYFRMVAAGILTEDDRVELLGGQIVDVRPSNPPHAAAVARVLRVFNRALRDDQALARDQSPLDLEPYDAPEPDVAVVRPRADEYARAHPTADAVLLVVEVSDRTRLTDRRVTLPTYAAAGLPEVWLLNLQQDRLEVYREAAGERYGVSRVYQHTERITPLAFPARALAVADLLPPGADERERVGERSRGRARDAGAER
jgi:Uma2 family endonuclease